MNNAETVNLLRDLTLNDGISVILKALYKWADTLISENVTNVPDIVIQFATDQIGSRHYAEIDKWSPRNYWETLVISFYNRIRKRGPIPDAQPPEKKHPTIRIDEIEITRRAQILASMTQGMTILQALDFLEDVTLQWSLICDEEWYVGNHSGFIFHLLAQYLEH